jgi:hypothetical protein
MDIKNVSDRQTFLAVPGFEKARNGRKRSCNVARLIVTLEERQDALTPRNETFMVRSRFKNEIITVMKVASHFFSIKLQSGSHLENLKQCGPVNFLLNKKL